MVFWDLDDLDEILELWDDDILFIIVICGEIDDDEKVQDVIRCDICDNIDLKLYCNMCMKSLCK